MSEIVGGPATIVFTDIEGSTSLWDSDAEQMRTAHQAHNEILIEVLEGCQGKIVKDKGDGFIAVFVDPSQAVLAATDIQRRISGHSWPPAIGELKVRVAVNTGLVESRGDDFYGPAMNLTARLEALTNGGQILVSEATRALTEGRLPAGLTLRDLGRQRLRGVDRMEQVYQVVGEGLEDDFPPLRAAMARGRRLPSFDNTFVGRESEIEEVGRLLQDGSRVLTILGPGGIGKTRLAVETASGLAESHLEDVFFADLSPLSSSDQVAETVAEALGVHAEGNVAVLSLVAERVDTPTLLVVDNIEHVIEASSELAGLLADAPLLRLLATSRQPLGIRGEHVYRLDPLAVVSNGKVSPAVELFYDRATSQGAHLTEADRPVVESLCRRLDGLPLAIELVAPRTRLVGVGELEDMLGDLLGSPGSGPAYMPERHRTIRAAIDWSMQSLTASQRTLFSRLAVLPAGANLEMLEKVCGHGLDGPLFENLAVLVDNSLVTSTPGLPGGTRFGQLALLREYGLEMLRDSGEGELTFNRLVDYYLEQAPHHASRLERGSGDAELSTDHANLMAAMEGSIEVGRVEDMARANLGVWVYWFRGDRIGPAVDWVGRAEQTTSSPYLDWLAGFFAFQTGDFEKLGVRMAAARSGFTDNGDEHGLALARMFGAMAVDDPAAGYEMLEAANQYFTESHDLVGRLIGPLFQSIIDFQTGDIESSLRRREEGLEASKGTALPELEAWMYWNLALSYYGVGRHDEALDALVRSFEYMAGDAYQEGVASSVEGIALLAIRAGVVEKAVQLLGAAQTIFDRIGTVTWFEAAIHVEAGITELKDKVGDDQYERWFEAGRQLSFSETVDLTYLVLSEMGAG